MLSRYFAAAFGDDSSFRSADHASVSLDSGYWADPDAPGGYEPNGIDAPAGGGAVQMSAHQKYSVSRRDELLDLCGIFEDGRSDVAFVCHTIRIIE